VTIFGILSWWFTPEEKWLRREVVLRALESTDNEEAVGQRELIRGG